MKTSRDLSIERLLRRWLTGGSKRTRPTPDQSSRPGPFGSGATGHCPDAEALAAFAEEGLSANERQSVEAHIADCHRCQALTAALVRTASTTPLATGDDQAALPWWKRRGTLNWLVPATAAMTALALWVAVPGQRRPAPEVRQAEVDTAAASQPAPATAPAAPVNVDAFRSPAGARADNQARSNETAAAIGSPASADAGAAVPAAPPPGRDQDTLARQERPTSQLGAVASEPARALEDRTAALASARAAAPAAGGLDVVSSDPQIRWRVGPGVAVQYSADGGSTWTTQETGASAPLTAGSSPSPSVCWLAGRAGTVLRTADGGRQWQRVPFPEAADLVAVSASNALTATVDLAGGRSFSTSDGGQTWTSVQK